MDFLRKLTKKEAGLKVEPATPAPPEAAKSEPPRNALEAPVQQAPPVLETVRKTEEQLRADALHTMDIMEAARADKGNFCLILGQGDSRALLLVAPAERVVPVSWQQGSSTTYTDYYLVTSNGVRRVSFPEGGWVPKEAQQQWNDKAKIFREIVDETVVGSHNLTTSGFRESRTPEGRTYLSIQLVSAKDAKKSLHLSANIDPQSHLYHEADTLIHPSTDEPTHRKVLNSSLDRVQAPVQAQIAQARSQIGALRGIKESLK